MCQDHALDEKFQELEVIADHACEVGENPIWHTLEKRLYWCDITAGRIFRYDPATEAHEQCYQGRTVGGFTIQSDGSLLLFMDRGTIAVWREGGLAEVVPEIPIELTSRFNDVIADPRGRVFCGTMSTEESQGRLYRLDCDGSLHLLLEKIKCSNGMAFTLDHKGFYYTDSLAREIYLFDYDVENGALSNRRTFAAFGNTDGLPDGATLDSDGNLWSALWDGGSIVRLLSDGKIGTRIVLPTLKVASLTFGGEDFSHIYITTGGGNNKQENGERAGALFRLKTKVCGMPEFFSRISVKE
jgi:D-xylono/L-arabinono-1,4-lactonase